MTRQEAVDHVVQCMADLQLAMLAEGYRQEIPDIDELVRQRAEETWEALTTVFAAEELMIAAGRAG